MPVGIERLNARRQQPNSRITFIKPLPGPDSNYAQDFLERIAAICHPIMKANHLSIMTLEEYEPNPEFVGRNFNAGEVIQLVLKAPYTGHWLSFRSVQMVMMHELAHCMQMNHSASFWKVRNQYADELRGLWAKNYTGDGFWGKGKTLLSEKYENLGPPVPEIMPRSLCGGTFRSRGRKRKRKADGPNAKTLTYAERQQKRIAKKFGTEGIALGGDEETRVKLEHGVKVKAKPKVAGSVRGRELRAAAAFARLGQQKKEEETTKADPGPESGSETEDEYQPADGETAVDLNGSSIRDSNGNSMVKICSDEDRNDANVKEEMRELQDLEALESQSRVPADVSSPRPSSPGRDSKQDVNQAIDKPTEAQKQVPSQNPGRSTSNHQEGLKELLLPEPGLTNIAICPICSMENEPAAVTCVVCAHVLDTKKVHGYWHCQSATCRGSQYLNAEDCALCGACGARRHGG